MASAPSPLIVAAFEVFKREGYANTTLAQIAKQAGCAEAEIVATYRDMPQLLGAVLKAYSPQDAMRAALLAVEGESAEELVRNSTHRLVGVIQQHAAFFELATVDMQMNGGNALTAMMTPLLPTVLQFTERLTSTKQLRPVPTPLLARTFLSMLIGYIVSERAMPSAMQMMMRIFPQKAWLDGMVDLLLYGVLEDDQR
ncbi:MAG: TetR family transcriptional regulator [Anaerolineae bacterium]|nr:TetR family transcriptional regulator [Anaerolineae bacterium]